MLHATRCSAPTCNSRQQSAATGVKEDKYDQAARLASSQAIYSSHSADFERFVRTLVCGVTPLMACSLAGGLEILGSEAIMMNR